LAAPVYNGTDLFFGGGTVTINGATYAGSVQELAPSTGAVVWATGLPGDVLGSPTLDGGGVLTAGIYGGSSPAIDLIDATSGAVIEQLTTGLTFGQSVFARNLLFTANSNGVAAWGLPAN
ncbi:MAG TPA: hypothetical protein VNW50_07710, partial [Streptosporangiaceae bacterium]|nr:hypothetical protein [Streptosporangiaceae bacterium]